MLHKIWSLIRNCYYREVGCIFDFFFFFHILRMPVVVTSISFLNFSKKERFFLSLKCLLMWLEVIVHLNYGNTLKGVKLHPLHPLSFFILSLELYLVSSIKSVSFICTIATLELWVSELYGQQLASWEMFFWSLDAQMDETQPIKYP